MAKYYVAGTQEGVDDPKIYLQKEEEYCKTHPEFLQEFWSGTSKDVFDFETALTSYMDGLKEDLKKDPQYKMSS